MTDLLKIKKDILAATKPVWHGAIVKELGVKEIEIINHKRSSNGGYTIDKIKIDGHQITNVSLDQYNNTHCSIGKRFPLKYLPLFGRILTELYPISQFNGRANYGVHVRYFERFSSHLSKWDILQMFETGHGWKTSKTEGFKDWLLGDGDLVKSSFYTEREPRPRNCRLPDEYHVSRKELT